MYCESLLFVATPNVAEIPANATVPLTQTARRVSQRIMLGSDAINVLDTGYYKVTATLSFTAPATGDATIEIHKNGLPVVGMTATESVGTANTEYHTVSIEGVIRVFCNESAVLTLVNTGIAIETSNVAVVVERVA